MFSGEFWGSPFALNTNQNDLLTVKPLRCYLLDTCFSRFEHDPLRPQRLVIWVRSGSFHTLPTERDVSLE